MSEPRAILLATTNPAKVERLHWALQGIDLRLVPLRDVPSIGSPEETGATFEENAVLKARAASAAWDGLAVATDGGVTIPALGDNWNGLFTARAAGPGADDRSRVEHLLELMAGKHGDERKVFWTESLAVGWRGERLASWTVAGNEGYLAEDFEPDKVMPGFWVATIWVYRSLGKRYPEMTEEERVRFDTPWTELRDRLQEFLLTYLAEPAKSGPP